MRNFLLKNNKKFISLSMVLLSCTVVFSSCPKVLADYDIFEHQQYKKDLEAEGLRLNKVLDEARQGKLAAADQKTAYEEKKSVIAQQLSETYNDIEDKNREIQEQEQIISIREMQLKDRKEEAKGRIREIYKAGETCTLDCLLNTKSVGDFLDKAHILKVVSDRDTMMIENTKTVIAKLNQEKQLLEESRDELNAKRVELTDKEDEYVQMISESNDWINQLDEDEQVALRDIDNNNLQINEINAKIEQYYEEQRFLEEMRKREEEKRKEEESTRIRSLEEEKLIEVQDQAQVQKIKQAQTQEKTSVSAESEQPKTEAEAQTKSEIETESVFGTEKKPEIEFEAESTIKTEVAVEAVDNNIIEISTEEVYQDEYLYLPTEQVQQELNSDQKVDVYTEEAFEEKEFVETNSYSEAEVEPESEIEPEVEIEIEVESEPEIEIQTEAKEQVYEETEEEAVKEPAVSKSGFIWPTSGFHWLSSLFNEGRDGYRHGGIDIAGAGIYGTPILAASDGVVSTSWYCDGGWGGGYGTYCMIDHEEGKSTLYAHMSSIIVSPGESVSKGQVIGYVGTTGESTGPHLHFETRLWGVKYDPMSEF